MKRKSVTVLTLCGLFVINSIPIFAASNQQISLPKNQAWMTAGSETRTGNFSYARAGCDAVYPETGNDNFSKIQVRLKNSNGSVISKESYTVLTEGNGTEKIYLKEGYMNTSSVTFQFRGNSSSSAKAIVDYNGL